MAEENIAPHEKHIYSKAVEALINEVGIPEDQIFQISELPEDEEFEFDILFKFYQENAIRHYHYGIEPVIFFYYPMMTINAGAICDYNHSGFNLIRMNRGIVEVLQLDIRDRTDLLTGIDELTEYVDFEKKLDLPINALMCDYAIHFTFYHELAHIIQGTNGAQEWIGEDLNNIGKFSFEKHLREYDADLFSSLSLGAHLIQYYEKIFKENIDIEDIKKVASMLVASIMIYFNYFPSYKLPLYLKENSHPHAMVRSDYITFTISDYFVKALARKGYNVEINPTEILEKAFVIVKSINGQLPIELYTNDMIEEYSESKKEIDVYVAELKMAQSADPSMAVNKWNKLAKN